MEETKCRMGEYIGRYDTRHLHSAIGYVTPQDKLKGHEEAIFAARDQKLAEARERRAQRRRAAAGDVAA